MNVLYLHTHDTGRVISSYGYDVHSPNFQALCEDSILFQQAFSVAPTCSPSRSALLTGVYPHQNGMLGLAQRGFELKKEMHLANVLSKNGYHTALSGVQHEVGYYTDHEKAIGTLGYAEDLSADNSEYTEEELIHWDSENADNVVEFLNDYDADKPFFVSYGLHATHRKYPTDIHPDEEVDYSQPVGNIPNNPTTREDFAQFKTSVRTADDNIGKVIQALKENGLYEKTIIVLTTDHGLANPFAKSTLKDSGIGVLLAIRVPNSTSKYRTFDGLISQIDIVPTLMDILALEKPEYLEGESFASIFEGQEYLGKDAIYGEINFHTSYEPVRAVRTERFKYIRFFDKNYLKINRTNIDNSSLKEFYSEHGLDEIEKEEEYLFDLYYDVYENNNLIHDEKYTEELDFMRGKLQDFMKKTDDPLLDGEIPIQDHWKVNKRETYHPGSKDPKDYDNLGK